VVGDRKIEAVINEVIRMKTLIIKSLLTSLFQREEKAALERGAGVRNSPLWQRGARGDFSIMMPYELLNE
jgi:hypothetical protein